MTNRLTSGLALTAVARWASGTRAAIDILRNFSPILAVESDVNPCDQTSRRGRTPEMIRLGQTAAPRRARPFQVAAALAVAAGLLIAGCGDEEPSVSADATGTVVDDAAGDDDGEAATSEEIGTDEGRLREDGGSSGQPTTSTGGEAPPPRPTSSSTAAPMTKAPAGTSGISGFVRISPTCPVEREGETCPAKPASATVSARPAPATKSDTSSSEVVASSRTAADGSFFLAVPPGRWAVEAVAESGETCKPVTVVVIAGSAAEVEVTCDSGMR